MSKFYQNKRRLEFQVGIVIVVAVLLLGISYSWLRNYLNSYRYQQIKVHFNYVDNIEPGSSVSVFGVKKGSVRAIEVQESGVLLTLQIEKSIPLKESSRFTIRETDLMGNREVSIIPSHSGSIISENSNLSGSVEYGLSHLVTKLNSVVDSTERMILKLEKDRSLFDSLEEIAKQSPKLLNDLNGVIRRFETNFSNLTEQLGNTAGNVDTLLVENRESLKKTFVEAEKIFALIADESENIHEIAENTADFSKKLKEENSTINQLVSNQELYDKLVLTTNRLDSLVIDVKKNPKKYINFSLF